MPAVDLSDLEAILHNVLNMADVSAAILEDAIGASHEAITGDRDLYRLERREVERMTFCADRTVQLAREALEMWRRISIDRSYVRSD